MSKLKNLIKKFRGKGTVKNHSTKMLWIVENTSTGKPIAHKLGPKRRSPPNIDADGFKRVDGKPIQKHTSWLKIYNYTTADIYDRGNGLIIYITVMKKIKENEFGNIKYDANPGWGIPLRNIVGVKKNKKGIIQKYFVEKVGWISKTQAVNMANKGSIDNAVIAISRNGNIYLRSKPDNTLSNNFTQMG